MSNVRVLGISGSPRRGRNTEQLLQAALEAAVEVGAEIELIKLSDLIIQPCNGCNTCIKEGKCPLNSKDDMDELIQKMLNADALILAAPSYFGSVPGITKNMMDRSRPLKMRGHELSNKIFSSIAVSALRQGGAEQVAESIARFGLIHGMILVGGCEDPLTSSHFAIASLQGDNGWRRVDTDTIALAAARGVGRRVAKIANSLKKNTELI